MFQSVFDLSEQRSRKAIARSANNPLKRLFEMILIKKECYINDLWELVGFESVSSRITDRHKMQSAIDWFLRRLVALNVVAFGENMGMQILSDTFQVIRMPKVIIGMLNRNKERPTILVYGNLDVEEAHMDEGWVTDPFVMSELGNYLYGRGVALDKGPLLCWLNAIQAYRDAALVIPVNIVFLIESMAHYGSMGLEAVLKERISFFRDVHCVVLATRRWQGNVTPCIVYGTRGVIYYHLEVECANRSLSSCEHSGCLYEALPDLIYLLTSLVDVRMNILFQGAIEPIDIDRNVFRITEFNYSSYGQSLDVRDLPHQTQKQAALAENWAMPHISIHGIDGANTGKNIRFVIPNKVIGKFSISLAPNQSAGQITRALQHHLGTVWVSRNSPNRMKLCEKLVIPPWTGNYDTPEYEAAAEAMTQTYQLAPNFIRDGGSLLAPSLFQQHLKANVLVLPIAKNDSGGCPINERLSIENYINGSQLMAAFIWEFANRVAEFKQRRKTAFQLSFE